MAALAAAGSLPLTAQAATNLKMMIPANPGGGWDSTGRALGKAIMDAKGADTVQYENKGGAAGVIGLAQFAATDRHRIAAQYGEFLQSARALPGLLF